jgi:two-component system, chemotaxis family, protein-glutamate methylesterase/glutaminase
MMQEKIRILVVDDSAVIRRLICDRIAAAPDLMVAGTARDGNDAIDKVTALRPDVITLDLQMPGMDGLAVLDSVLASVPTPVIMVSALTRAGAAVTLDALDRGAVDYVAKPEPKSGGQSGFEEELVAKIRSAACMDISRLMAARKRRRQPGKGAALQRPATPVAAVCPEELAGKCIAIGISTGGPPALTRLLSELRPPMPPIVIVQHMPPQFTGPLAARLDGGSALSVHEAANGDVLQANGVLIAPGGRQLEVVRRGAFVKIVLSDGEAVSGHKPSADVMMTSAAKAFGRKCLGVIMTGMGRDGANGCRAIREAGGFVLGQDEASSDVYGMNKVAFVEGNVDQQMSLSESAVTITQRIQRLGCVAATV